MRAILAICLAMSAAACGGKNNADDDGDGGQRPDACVGIECDVVDCGKMSLPPTSISGKVFAPNGTLPLNGVNVYVPREALPAFVEGATCDRCATTLPGSPVVQTVSDAHGNFKLDNVPAGSNIPLVITTGKWRRQVTIPTVASCGDNAIGAADTSLPKSRAEGDIPKIAITTGSADTMECLVRKLGLADSEISPSGDARIHLYAGNGVDKLKNGFAGGSNASLNGAQAFWDSFDNLKAYDIVILSCEGSQVGGTPKSQGALDAMKQYSDIGGRVFASHWHNIWIGGRFQGGTNPTQATWAPIATWTAADSDPGDPILIDEVANPKGGLFAEWMLDPMVGGSTVRDQIALADEAGGGTTGRRTATTLDVARGERWVKTSTGDSPQMFQFTTPVEVANDQRCGKVVFTDMHVSGQSDNQNGDYPDNCLGGANNLTLTPQEKALAFMFFDIAGCVGGIF
ncbi:MAG: carboxypeptidase regulatory-like domain-containing protein [Kofleriaceae bacterium]